MKIVLYQPEIPHNTGNIVRTCALTKTPLFLIRPLGFSVSNRHLKRSGLDYWPFANVQIFDELEPLINEHPNFFFFSSQAIPLYTEISYKELENPLLIFGSETKGLPDIFRERWGDRFYTIPSSPIFREKNPLDSGCLNLSNAVSIVLYEALRQRAFADL